MSETKVTYFQFDAKEWNSAKIGKKNTIIFSNIICQNKPVALIGQTCSVIKVSGGVVGHVGMSITDRLVSKIELYLCRDVQICG